MANLTALLRLRARELTEHLEAALGGDVTGVHQGRVASRRLRESLPSSRRSASLTRARKALRAVTRALGPVRELDVALGHLEDGLEGSRIPRIALERVRAHVTAERERRRERMLLKMERVDVAGAVSRVERIAVSSRLGLTDAAVRALATRVRVRAAGLAGAVDRAGTLYAPDRLHAVRIAGKKLRYALEVLASASLARVGRDLKLLKDAQEVLGVMHDYQVLLEHVADVRGATPRGAPGAAGLAAMAAAYDRECRKLHATYLKLAPGLAASARRLRKLEPKVRNTRRAPDGRTRATDAPGARVPDGEN